MVPQTYVAIILGLLGVLVIVLSLVLGSSNDGAQDQALVATTGVYSTLSTYVDSYENTWSLGAVYNSNGAPVLQMQWSREDVATKTFWDSVQGACGSNNANFISVTAALAGNSAQPGVTLAQTPSFVDQYNILRTFRLQLYPGDLRIESGNGDGRYWSVYQTNTNSLTGWPTSADPTILWQLLDVSQNFAVQFTTDGELGVRPIYWKDGGSFLASTWIAPYC